VRLLFGASDAALLALAFQSAYWIRSHLRLENAFFLGHVEAVALLMLCIAVWLGCAGWFEIYDRIEGVHPRVIIRDASLQCLLGAISVVLIQYSLRLDLSRSFLALFLASTWMLLCLFRLNASRLVGVVRREFGQAQHIMIVGTGDRALGIARQLEEAVNHTEKLTGFLADSADATSAISLAKTYPVHTLADLPELLKKHVIDEIIFAVDSRRLAELEEVFLLCDEEGVRTRVAMDFFPHVNSRIYFDRLGPLPLLVFSATPHDELRLLVKRLTDILLAGAALVLLFPFMLVIAVLIRLTSPGPALFRQERCGLNGRRFMFYKFRSMCENADAMRASVEHLSTRQLALKIPNDPRLTPVGRWLRKFSVDEWPQLWNVLKGDMSLVGPRPAIPQEVELYERWQRRRLRMRPGLTCLWAVSGRDAVDFETWMRLDMQYIDNWSLALDWKIILRTIPQVLSGRAN
jgi:exopolysaccharide biosynthesis polyprenyl glycosylphosphotransferase